MEEIAAFGGGREHRIVRRWGPYPCQKAPLPDASKCIHLDAEKCLFEGFSTFKWHLDVQS